MINESGFKFMTNYICDGCGKRIYINIDDKCCPECGYENPMCKNVETKCDVCGSVCLTDQYGNGDCEKCGWAIDNECRNQPDRVRYPNLVSLNKAKRLYKEKKPLVPSLDDFIEGLMMYSEMEFDYNGNHYGVDFYYDKEKGRPFGNIEFYKDKATTSENFKSIQEFKNNAKIDGRLLKDIWQDVKNARYMICE